MARNIEWSELIPALSSIGLLQTEKNGSCHLTRNGHTLVFEISHRKELDVEDVLKLRHFLQVSAVPEDSNTNLMKDAVVVLDHHHAIICHNPGTPSEQRIKLHVDLTKDRILHTHPTSAPFHESSPRVDSDYYESVIKEMAKSNRIVILSHGTGTSNAASQLLAILHKTHPGLVDRIVAIKNCDIEAMTEPQLIQSGIESFRVASAN
jgi:hypothetical protein